MRQRLLASASSAVCVLLACAPLAAAVAGAAPRVPSSPSAPSSPSETSAAAADIAAARAVFNRNLQAIRDKDSAHYLACYLDSDRLARTGPEGIALGYADLAASSGKEWPDHIDAEDLRFVPIQPGIVYGTYRYRVRYGAQEVSGLSERLFVGTPQGWRIAMTSAFPALPGVPPPPRALVGGTLLDGNGGAAVADSVVVVREGKIDCAGTRSACPVPDGIATIDLAGRFVTPGLVDAHVHFSQTGWADGRPDALDAREQFPYDQTEAGLEAHPERFARSYLCSGVTSVFDVGGYPWTLTLPGWAETRSDVPRVASAGPLLSTWDFWLNQTAERQFVYLADAAVAKSGVSYLAAHGSAAVKVWFIPPSAKNDRTMDEMEKAVHAAGDEAHARKLPLIVHATGLAEAKAALRSGANLLVHSVEDKPVDDEFLALAKKNGTLYCPTLTVRGGYLRMFQSAVRHEAPKVDDPNRCVDKLTMEHVRATGDLPFKKYTPEQLKAIAATLAAGDKIAADNLKRVAAAGIPIVMGTDAGNPLTLHGPSVYAEMEAMQAAGLPAADVLVSATRGGALALGRAKELGTIEKGKIADLLVVDADPAADIKNLRRLRYVVRGGVVRTKTELSALATEEAK